jgi:hypothetical protein
VDDLASGVDALDMARNVMADAGSSGEFGELLAGHSCSRRTNLITVMFSWNVAHAPLKPFGCGTDGNMREQAQIVRPPIEFDVAASSDLENTLNVHHSSDTPKALFPFNFIGGMLEVHARERFSEHGIELGVVNEQRTNRAEEL